ncbi:MAG TPA: hypothetical protein VGO32_07555 [Candidatus Limnocylindria bacterium]|nr:hypothetical protein [Candidatus Limnocylindria bacterium]
MTLIRLLVAAALFGLAVACSPTPAGSSVTATAALDLVRGEDPLFTGVIAHDPEAIGQAGWFEQTETEDGWEIVIRIGWGDCPAGCISEHRWTYTVTVAGEVTLVEESGHPLPTDTAVRGTVVAGPTCPVMTDPPDPSCADRPVSDAELVVLTGDGAEVARTTSATDGTFAIALASGAYRLEPQPVEGLMGTAEPIEFSVVWGMPIPELVVSYDTGIR